MSDYNRYLELGFKNEPRRLAEIIGLTTGIETDITAEHVYRTTGFIIQGTTSDSPGVSFQTSTPVNRFAYLGNNQSSGQSSSSSGSTYTPPSSGGNYGY